MLKILLLINKTFMLLKMFPLNNSVEDLKSFYSSVFLYMLLYIVLQIILYLSFYLKKNVKNIKRSYLIKSLKEQ